MFLFLARFCSLPRTGKALFDNCGLMLQTQWRENAPKREKFIFRQPYVAQKRLCLSSLITHATSIQEMSSENISRFQHYMYSISYTTAHVQFHAVDFFFNSDNPYSLKSPQNYLHKASFTILFFFFFLHFRRIIYGLLFFHPTGFLLQCYKRLISLFV